jgi:3-hydroxyacyl-CoA dehydrogenase
MKYQIHRAVVIGSGTMGAAIAAHLANVGVWVTLLDIVPDRLTRAEEKIFRGGSGGTKPDRAGRTRRALKSR